MKFKLISFFLSLLLILSPVSAVSDESFSGYSKWAYTEQVIAPEIDTSYYDEIKYSDEDQVAKYFLPYVKFMS